MFGKAFQEKELSIGDWKWAVYQTITRLTFHQGNKHTYAYKWSSLLEPIICPWMKVFLILIFVKVISVIYAMTIWSKTCTISYLNAKLTMYQIRTVRGNWNINKIVLSRSRVFRVTALSKAAVLNPWLLFLFLAW